MRGETSPPTPCLVPMLALPCPYVMGLSCPFNGLRGNKHSKPTSLSLKSTDKGITETLSCVIIGLGQNARWSEAFDKFQA